MNIFTISLALNSFKNSFNVSKLGLFNGLFYVSAILDIFSNNLDALIEKKIVERFDKTKYLILSAFRYTGGVLPLIGSYTSIIFFLIISNSFNFNIIFLVFNFSAISLIYLLLLDSFFKKHYPILYKALLALFTCLFIVSGLLLTHVYIKKQNGSNPEPSNKQGDNSGGGGGKKPNDPSGGSFHETPKRKRRTEEEKKQYARDYRQKNSEKINKQQKNSRDRRSEENKQYAKESARDYKQKNSEKIKQ